ncbi:MAG: phytoene/squalene synthase family protein [Paracoccaceae bacterium]
MSAEVFCDDRPVREAAIACAEVDARHCREAIRTGSKSFHAASRLLPARVREPAFALYAFCRLADDAVDEGGRAGASARRARRLGLIATGRPAPHPADRAFARVIRRHAIPVEIPAALIEGLSWDEGGRRYETLADVEAYAARVAATVGVMMTLILGERRPEVLARAADLGVAMQLSNIARDVGEDARAGRLYLPRGWMRAEGLDPDAFLAAPAHSPALGRVVGRLLDRAETLYDRSLSGIARLPRDCRPGIAAARLMYREIGRTVAALMRPRPVGAAPLDACAFLIEAVERHDRLDPAIAHALGGRLTRALDFFVKAAIDIERRGLVGS